MGSVQRLVSLLLGAVGLLVGEVVACLCLRFVGLPSWVGPSRSLAVTVLASVRVFVGSEGSVGRVHWILSVLLAVEKPVG